MGIQCISAQDQPEPMSIEMAMRLYDSDCQFNASMAEFQAEVTPISELSLVAVIEAARPAFRLGFSYAIRQDSEGLDVLLRHSGGGEDMSSVLSGTVISPALLLAGLLGIPLAMPAQASNPDQHTNEPEGVQPEQNAIDALTESQPEVIAEPAAGPTPEEPDLIGPDSPDNIPGDHPSLRLLAPEEIEAAVGLIKVMTAQSRKSFTIAFRNAFEVPDNVMRIAGEITQLRHLQFIDRFNLEAAGGISA